MLRLIINNNSSDQDNDKKQKIELIQATMFKRSRGLEDVIYFAMKHRVHHVIMHRIMKNAVVINEFVEKDKQQKDWRIEKTGIRGVEGMFVCSTA